MRSVSFLVPRNMEHTRTLKGRRQYSSRCAAGVSATAVATVATIATVLSAPTTPLPLTMSPRCHRRCWHTSYPPLLHPRCVATHSTADAAYACISATDFTSNANTDVIPSLLELQATTFLTCRCHPRRDRNILKNTGKSICIY